MNNQADSSNSFLTSLPTREFDLLKPHLKLVELRHQSLLVQAGDEITHAYCPHSGVVSMVVNLDDGETVEVAMVGRESLFGVSAAIDGEKSPNSAIVTLPGIASTLEVEHVRLAAARSEDFRMQLRRHERAVLVQAQQSAACNAVHPVESRLSRWLLHAADRSGGDALALTQDFIARMLGIQRNSVTIAAHGLQDAGLIRCSRGYIEIIDREALITNSCECYRDVKTHCDRLFRRDRHPVIGRESSRASDRPAIEPMRAKSPHPS